MPRRRLGALFALLPLLAACGASNATPAATPPPALAGSTFSLSAGWTRSISPNADSTPAFLPRVRLPNGQKRSMLFVLAGNNTSNCNTGDPVTKATLYAFDAANGTPRWQRSTSGPSRCTTSAPAAASGWVYAAGLDGKVHRYHAATGSEYRKQGWPKTVTLSPDVEKMSANLRYHSPYLYATTSGFIGDQGHYQGHLVTIDVRTGATSIFNSLCSNIRRLLTPTPAGGAYCAEHESGLFGRGQAVTDPLNGDVYIVSGNGPWNGRTDWGDSIMKLDPAGRRLLDSFTPTNQQALADGDQDLGSTGPAIVPAVHAGRRTYHLLVQGGKGPACDSCRGAALRLLNRDNLSGRGGPGRLGGDLQDVQAPGGCEVLTAPTVWTAPDGSVRIFYVNDCGDLALRLTTPSHGVPRLTKVWSNATGGTTPVVAGGVLYVADEHGHLDAYDASTGALRAQVSIGPVHWEYPLIAGGRVYISDESGKLMAFRIG